MPFIYHTYKDIYGRQDMVDSTFQFTLSSFSGIQWNPVESTIPGGGKRTHPKSMLRGRGAGNEKSLQ